MKNPDVNASFWVAAIADNIGDQFLSEYPPMLTVLFARRCYGYSVSHARSLSMDVWLQADVPVRPSSIS